MEEIIAQIKRLSLSITEETYYAGVQNGYELHGIVRKAHSFRGGWIAHLFYKFDVYVIVDFIHIL